MKKLFIAGSTSLLVLLCVWYFSAYVATGVSLRYFIIPREGFDHLSGMQFLYYSTVGGVLFCLVVVALGRWPRRLQSQRHVTRQLFWLFPIRYPREYDIIVPSGICTAIVIPTTTYMYTFGMEVMVAMTLMRASVMIVSRIVDAVYIQIDLLDKKVSWQENVSVGFAALTVVAIFLWPPEGGFDILKSVPAMFTMGLYITSYAIRLFIMNYYKLKAKQRGEHGDVLAFFSIEQAFAVVVIILVGGFFIASPDMLGWDHKQLLRVVKGFHNPQFWPILAGVFFGAAAIPSVMLFMFKGRTATFSGLANRLTSLTAGTLATIIICVALSQEFPGYQRWIALGLVLTAIFFLILAEKRYKNEEEAKKKKAKTPEGGGDND